MATSTKPLVLYTAGTPNGRKVSIHLEEFKAAYSDLDYSVHKVELSKNIQKEPWYINTLNPNGRIPTLVDKNRPTTTNAEGFSVFESAAIMLYLSNHYDKEHKLWFDPVEQPEHYSEMLQWIFFTHGGIGPMQGQANHFLHAAQEDIPYAKKRYIDETKRLYGVLQIRLANREWLAGPGKGVFSIADINAFPWVRVHKFAEIQTLDEWPNVKKWIEAIEARPAVQAGLVVPS
jgi:glutathione S-transferase